MRQIVQFSGNGKIAVVEAPEPRLAARRVKIRTLCSLVSAGTERSKIELGEKSLLGKARARPDLVSKVWEKAQREGLWSTYRAVRERLDAATPLGYSLAGVVTEVGAEAEGVRPGDLVAAAGAGFANHADYVVVPHTLVASIPEGVSTEDAAFTTLGAIALQGIRQTAPLLGETFLVLGLGLIGQLTTRLLRANGCHVIGYDPASRLVDLARRNGAVGVASEEDIIPAVLERTGGYGVDGTIVCASSRSNGPIVTAGEATRERGRVVVVGAVPMDVPREPYYMKEIDLRLSRSYGPGRYDSRHEEGGIDYPFGYVRFTEGRNMQAFLELLAGRRIAVADLVTHRFAVEEATQAYDLLSGARQEPYLGIVISYPEPEGRAPPFTGPVRARGALDAVSKPSVAFIGAGNYAVSKLLPVLRDGGRVRLGRICTASGRSAADIAQRFGFAGVAQQPTEVFEGPDEIVFVATRHSTHCSLAAQALKAGKHVFVEKPLCLTGEELIDLCETYSEASGQLMVGFNRRFAPFTGQMRQHFQGSGIRHIVIRVNAGQLAADHWSLNPSEGGRVVGEACHFVDLACALADSAPATVHATTAVGPGVSAGSAQSSHIHMVLRNGATASIVYAAEGSAALAKERIEAHGGGKSAVIEDWRELILYPTHGKPSRRREVQDKGQKAMIETFLASLGAGDRAISPSLLFAVSEATVAIVESARTGETVAVGDYTSLDTAHG